MQLQRADAISTDTDGLAVGLAGRRRRGRLPDLVRQHHTAPPFTFYDTDGNTTTTASAVTGAQLDFIVRTNRGRSTRFIERVTVRSRYEADHQLRTP